MPICPCMESLGRDGGMLGWHLESDIGWHLVRAEV